MNWLSADYSSDSWLLFPAWTWVIKIFFSRLLTGFYRKSLVKHCSTVCSLARGGDDRWLLPSCSTGTENLRNDRPKIHPVTFQSCFVLFLWLIDFYELFPRWKCEINPEGMWNTPYGRGHDYITWNVCCHSRPSLLSLELFRLNSSTFARAR